MTTGRFAFFPAYGRVWRRFRQVSHVTRIRWHRRAPLRALVATAAASLAVAGCGEDDEGRRAFAAAAEQICADANSAATGLATQIAIAQRGSDTPAVYRDVGALTGRRADTARRYLDRLDALEVPDEDRDEIKAWLAGQRRRQTLVDALARAFSSQDDARISTLSQRIDASNSASTAFAARQGWRACAKTIA